MPAFARMRPANSLRIPVGIQCADEPIADLERMLA